MLFMSNELLFKLKWIEFRRCSKDDDDDDSTVATCTYEATEATALVKFVVGLSVKIYHASG